MAVMTIADAVLEDVTDVLESINEQLAYNWGCLRAAVLAETPGARVSTALHRRLVHMSTRAGNAGGGLFLVLYAIDSNKNPVPYSELKT